MAEEALNALAENTDSTEFTTLRIFNAYGTGLQKSLIELLRTSTPDNPVSLFDSPEFYRDYVHVSDIAKAAIQACNYQQPVRHTTINIASGVPKNNQTVLKEMTAKGIEPHYKLVRGSSKPDYSWANTRAAQYLLGLKTSGELILDH